MNVSYLSLGGWDEDDLASDIVWYSAQHTWNQTLTELKFNGITIADYHDYTHVSFEIGYPYIGLSERYYDRLASYLMEGNMNVNCTKGEHWGLCRVPDTKCTELPLNQLIEVTIENHKFTIPLQNIASYVNVSDHYFCHINVAMLNPSDENAVILGSAFFTSFVGIFDVDGDRLGLAASARALSGNSITCVSDCQAESSGDEAGTDVDVP